MEGLGKFTGRNVGSRCVLWERGAVEITQRRSYVGVGKVDLLHVFSASYPIPNAPRYVTGYETTVLPWDVANKPCPPGVAVALSAPFCGQSMNLITAMR